MHRPEKLVSAYINLTPGITQQEFKMLHVNHPDLSFLGNTNHSPRTYETRTSEDAASLWMAENNGSQTTLVCSNQQCSGPLYKGVRQSVSKKAEPPTETGPANKWLLVKRKKRSQL